MKKNDFSQIEKRASSLLKTISSSSNIEGNNWISEPKSEGDAAVVYDKGIWTKLYKIPSSKIP